MLKFHKKTLSIVLVSMLAAGTLGTAAAIAGGDINSDKPFKFIYHDKVYIWLNGVIYDTTGKRVK